MPVLVHIGFLATCAPAGGQADIQEIRDAALAWDGDTIRWVGSEIDLPEAFANMEKLDAAGATVIPGLIDCHTHLAFGGWRAGEFERRLKGAGYLEIARAGGGIASTVKATRAASEDELFHRCLGFLRDMSRLGITTVEAKSGYGLDVENEIKILRLYRRLNQVQPVEIIPTLLGAHVVPPEYRDDRQAYVDLLCRELIPEVARQDLARFCDVFVEDTAFSIDEARRILQVAASCGLRPKLHADQLTDGGGAALAAEVHAASADHLECTGAPGIEAMARAGIVAVSLPLASLVLGQSPLNARALVDAGVHVAVATDFNPGTAPSYHLPMVMMLACTLQRLTPAEVLKGATRYAAEALGIENWTGSLLPGHRADFVLLDAPDVNHWLYHFRANAVLATFAGGIKIPEEA